MSSVHNGEETSSSEEIMSTVDNGEETSSSEESKSTVDNGEETTSIREDNISSDETNEERMWCSHCGQKTPTRREGKNNTVKSCYWCGKILADETGTSEEYNRRFMEYLIRQNYVPQERRRFSPERKSPAKDPKKPY